MTTATASQPAPPAASDDFAQTLLDVSLTGFILFRPVYAEPGGPIQDLAYEYLNPAAQRMLRLSERPAESFLTLYPATQETGIFAFYAAAFASGQIERYQVNYQDDGLDGYFYLVARRSGERLVVSFTDTNDQSRSVVEEALRHSQAREQQARAEAEKQRQRLLNLFAQAPALLATMRGPDHVFELVNARYQVAFGSRQLEGLPYREVAPELAPQGIFDVLDQVYRTGETYFATEALVYLEEAGRLTPYYYNFIYQATHDAAGHRDGILNFAYEVTDQVLARQRVQTLNEELATLNEELQASNEEYLLTNTALNEAQQQLQQLNTDLEARVQRRTQELQASHQATEVLQAELLAAARRQVQEREDLYQVFAQTPAVVLLLRGPQHRIEYLNAAAERLFPGRPLRGRTIAESQPEVVAQGLVAQLDRVYHTGETYLGNEVPLTLLDEAGQPVTTYFNFSYQAYREQGQIAGISVFAYDATAQALAREAQQREWQRVFEQAPEAIVIVRGKDLIIELANEAICAIWGRRPEQLLGRSYFEAVPEMVGQGLEEIFAQVLHTGEPLFIDEAPVALDRAHTGRPAVGYFNFIFQSLRDEQQRSVGIVAVGTEVTNQVLARQQVQDLNQELAAINEELAATNEELHESNTRLLRTNADLDNFVYTASHDLKSPISNIEGLLLFLPELLPDAVRTDEQVAPVLARMQESVERFKRTLGHLTEISKLQAEFAQPAVPVHLPTVVEDVRQDLLPQLTATQAQLEVDIDACQPRVFSEKNLRSLLYNLLSNALKYRHPDRPAHVRLACTQEGNHLVLTVQDNGLGLSESQQQRLFQLFQRLHTHVEGSGVGLYMVKKIIDQAGGHITVQSRLGIGTTFTLVFPA